MKKEMLESVEEILKRQCVRSLGGVDTSFLCASISVLEPRDPVIVNQSLLVREVMEILHKKEVGCVLVTENEQLVGIFSERDYIVKAVGDLDAKTLPVSELMTKDPVTIQFDDTVAYAITLMSHGQFRHLPITDNDEHPVAVVTANDLIDHLAKKIMEDLLKLEVDE